MTFCISSLIPARWQFWVLPPPLSSTPYSHFYWTNFSLVIAWYQDFSSSVSPLIQTSLFSTYTLLSFSSSISLLILHLPLLGSLLTAVSSIFFHLGVFDLVPQTYSLDGAHEWYALWILKYPYSFLCPDRWMISWLGMGFLISALLSK